MRAKKIAMLGGTYDPIHYGHLSLGMKYADVLGLDRIYVVPTRTPPHKLATETPGEMRLEMCRLALESLHDKRFVASDIELRRDGLSWSYYTVCALREQNPGAEFYLMVGADMFMTLETWHRFDELKEMVNYCSVPRDENSLEILRRHAGHLESLGCRTTLVEDFAPVPISSTLIRDRIAAGLDIDGLTPPAVVDYIRENRLYGSTEVCD